MDINFPTDGDGFLSQECPHCKLQFKLVFGETSDGPISFCPYCRFEGRNCWWTQAQAEYISAVATTVVLGPEFKKLERTLKHSSGGFLNITLKSNIPTASAPPMEIDKDFERFCFPCCNETVKVECHDKLFCIICGKEVDVKMSDSKMVLLSHKGMDKDLVIDFKETLQLLGYEPWIDEDAMPAGTPLERGLLKGMQDSCGVVFFITPSFKDEGYLETEINYAIQEKRKKGDNFAIITLQFVENDGRVGKIPELLKTYVWKKPRTHLRALREIIRALPIRVGEVDWREGIDGVVLASKLRSRSTELSDQARTILLEAAAGDSTILHARYLGGEQIQTNRKSVIPENNQRTIALWVGGLEDLIRRRFIKDIGHKGEVFEVTREGYEAADEIQKAAGNAGS